MTGDLARGKRARSEVSEKVVPAAPVSFTITMNGTASALLVPRVLLSLTPLSVPWRADIPEDLVAPRKRPRPADIKPLESNVWVNPAIAEARAAALAARKQARAAAAASAGR